MLFLCKNGQNVVGVRVSAIVRGDDAFDDTSE